MSGDGRYHRRVSISDHPVVASLTPVFILIALGYLAGRLQWIRAASIKDLSNLVFFLLIPALLFRTMSTVHIEALDFRPVMAYLLAALLLLGGNAFWRGGNRRSVVMALGSVFSNLVAIGITVVQLAYGKDGVVTLLTLVSLHHIVLLTVTTLALEVVVAGENRAGGKDKPHMLATTWLVFKGTLIHPVLLPIFCGLAFAQTGWTLPAVVDKPLALLGSAFGPLALVLVGLTMTSASLAGNLRPALWIVVSKNLLLPLMVGVSAWAFGINGLTMTVLVVTAALPMGANVFMFAQRYEAAQDLTTAAMVLSTGLALFTLTLAMLVMAWLNQVQ